MAHRMTAQPPAKRDEDSADELLALAHSARLKGFEDAGNAPPATGQFHDVTLADSVEDILELAKEMGLKGFADVAVAGE